MRQNKALHPAATPLAELCATPIHTREIGSHLTNVLRCLYLEACGYQVTVTELVGWEHSMKNAAHHRPLHRPENAAAPSACASCWSNLVCKRRWRTAIPHCHLVNKR